MEEFSKTVHDFVWRNIVNSADVVKIEETLTTTIEFIDDDIIVIYRHEVLRRRAKQSYASEIR